MPLPSHGSSPAERSPRLRAPLLLLALSFAGCHRGYDPPDLGGIYNRAARHEGLDRNPIIVIPGVMGSSLVDALAGRTASHGSRSGHGRRAVEHCGGASIDHQVECRIVFAAGRGAGRAVIIGDAQPARAGGGGRGSLRGGGPQVLFVEAQAAADGERVIAGGAIAGPEADSSGNVVNHSRSR